MSALSPRLTPLDQLVLAQLPEDGSAVRWSVIWAGVVRASRKELVGGTPERRVAKQRALERDVRAILRGCEHLGLIVGSRGGWWRRC